MANIEDYFSRRKNGTLQINFSSPDKTIENVADAQNVADALESLSRDHPAWTRSRIICEALVAQAARQAQLEICPSCELEVDEVLPLPVCDGDEICHDCFITHLYECKECHTESDKWQAADQR